jgi:DNA-binding MarR family transcriptional regulator
VHHRVEELGGDQAADRQRDRREFDAQLQYSANRIVADLDELELRGLVVRVPAADRRANVLSVIRSGAAVQRRIQREIHAREDELLAGLSATQQRQLHTVVDALARRLRAPGR